MHWIKRNLFLAIGGLVALALLAGGGYYVYSGIGMDNELKGGVESTRSKLNTLYGMDPFPHATNIATAKAEAAKVNAAVAKSQKHFAAVPVEKMDTLKFRTLRDSTLGELRRQAKQASVKLPTDDYAFSFETQRRRFEFGPGTFPGVPEQMMEIKELCKVLFDARINQLGNIRRARVSEDDRRSSNGGDYLDRVLDNATLTAVQAESHPYEVTFFSFSSELAAVLNGMERAPYGFVTKAVMVEPEDARMADAGGAAMAGVTQPVPVAQPLRPPRPGPRPNPAAAAAAAGNPVHLLKEKRLKITMLVYAIKPAPSSGR